VAALSQTVSSELRVLPNRRRKNGRLVELEALNARSVGAAGAKNIAHGASYAQQVEEKPAAASLKPESSENRPSLGSLRRQIISIKRRNT